MEKKRILIADDDPEIRKVIRELLGEKRYEFDDAADGTEVLELVEKKEFHLIIMDIMMPQMDGIAAITKIRETQNVPILVLSAKAEEVDRVLGLTVGADDYLVKPFYKAELTARVSSLLRRYTIFGGISQENTNPDILSYHDISINTREKTFLICGEAARLTPTEYKMMVLFLQKPEQVISTTEIYEKVWQEKSFDSVNAVMVHMSRLRKKMKTYQDVADYLKVVWGVGYKLDYRR